MTARYDRDRLIADTDLELLADELLGPHTGRATKTWRCPNPVHKQSGRTPPVSVFRSRRGEQRWYCHGCGAGGTAIDLLLATRGLDLQAALEALAQRAHLTPDKQPSPRTTPPQARPQSTGTLAELDEYVDACARNLWADNGQDTRRWLTETRGLPTDLLRAHRIGADPGPGRLVRPNGVPRIPGVVLPALDAAGRAIFTQTRWLAAPQGQPRYLNCSSSLAPNPRMATYRPRTAIGRGVIVCEGAIDGLSAAAAGYRAAAILGTATINENLADRLAALNRPLLLALDNDEAGHAANSRLRALLHQRNAQVHQLHLPEGPGDLNEWMVHTGSSWPSTLRSAARSAPSASPALARA
jgi:DNA primase